MAHPDVEQAMALGITTVFDAFQQPGMSAGADLCIAKFAYQAIFDPTAKLRRHSLHAIADAEHGYSEFEHRLRCARCAVYNHRSRTARQDDSLRCEAAHELITDVMGVQFAVNPCLTHATRNQLAVLSAEIQYQNFIVSHRTQMWEQEREAATSSSRKISCALLRMRRLFNVIVGRFLDDLYVVNMGFPHTRCCDLYELRALLDSCDGGAAQVAHCRAQASHQLVHDLNHTAFVRNTPFHAFRHELVRRVFIILKITVA